VDEQLRRTRLDHNRPLLQTADPHARLSQLIEQRDPLYREVADCIISTEDQPIKQVVRAILHQLDGGDSSTFRQHDYLPMKTLHVELGDRRYPIHIGPGLLTQVGPVC